jgi:carbonic anhydrase
MNQLDEILAFNKSFVENEGFLDYKTDKFPFKKMVVFSCMDTRLTSLLPIALNLKNGDAKIIKNAGAVIMHPFGSVMRSIIVAVYELGAKEIFVVGHKGCGMSSVNTSSLINEMKNQGVSEETFKTLNYSGIDIKTWLHGFDCVEQSVRESVDKISNHPLLPKHILVHGLIMDSETGAVDVIVDGNS